MDMLDTTSVTGLYTLLGFGVGAVCLGIPGLFLSMGRGGQRSWLTPMVLACLLALAGGAAALAQFPSYTYAPMGMLSVLLLGMALLRSPVWVSSTQMIFWLLRHPRAQSASLVLLGLVILSWQAYAQEQKLSAELADTDRHLSALTTPPPLQSDSRVKVWTDAGREILLYRPAEGVEDDDRSVTDHFLRSNGFDVKLIQTAPPDHSYNCHGWVFTGGKGWILGSEVERILRDNQYHIVSTPSAGDLALFRDSQGAVSHTAVVRAVAEDGTVLMESKWGKIGRYIHTATQHVYASGPCVYYRSPRSQHTLRMEGP